MRKNYFIIILMVGLSLLLIGCGKETNDELEVKDAEKIEIVSVDEPEVVLSTIDEPSDVVNFVNKLKIQEWVTAEIPSTAKESFMFHLYRPETEKLLDSKSNGRELQLISIITVFQNDSYIKLETKLLDFTFKIPDDVAEYLNNW